MLWALTPSPLQSSSANPQPATTSVHEPRRAQSIREFPFWQPPRRLLPSSRQPALTPPTERVLSFVHSFRKRLGVSLYPSSAAESSSRPRSPRQLPIPRIPASAGRQWCLLRGCLGLSVCYPESSKDASATRRLRQSPPRF